MVGKLNKSKKKQNKNIIVNCCHPVTEFKGIFTVDWLQSCTITAEEKVDENNGKRPEAEKKSSFAIMSHLFSS